MFPFSYSHSIIGGLLIGVSAVLLYTVNGRIAGISGILNSRWAQAGDEVMWRLYFLVGLVGAGFIYKLASDSAVPVREGFPLPLLALAGVLVGFGTSLGSGCTSGHGVCGISRLSTRSLLATLVFIGAGVATVAAGRHLFGGLV